jgi:hypothetical protein
VLTRRAAALTEEGSGTSSPRRRTAELMTIPNMLPSRGTIARLLALLLLLLLSSSPLSSLLLLLLLSSL